MTTKRASQEHEKFKHGKHPNSLKNLKPFQVGHAPLGAAILGKGYSLTSEIKHQLHEESEFIAPHARPKDKLWRQQIAREMLVKSAQGDVGMVKELLDRTEGKVKDTVNIEGTSVVIVYHLRESVDATK